MSMKDLRASVNLDETPVETVEMTEEHIYSSLHLRISPDPNRTPIVMKEHFYENMLYLPMTDAKTTNKTPQKQRPLPDLPKTEETDDNTCDFTSEPQKGIHKPVALKTSPVDLRISNDLIARFGKSPNDRQHPLPQYGLYISTEPSKKPCKLDSQLHEDVTKPSTESKNVYKSTGQHVHCVNEEPVLPLHNLRPPPLLPPKKVKSKESTAHKTKSHKLKAQGKPKSETQLPVIYENTRQEDAIAHKRRRLQNSMSIEFSFEDDDSHDTQDSGNANRSSEDASLTGSSPRAQNSSGSDNPDSGVSEGVTTPLISPLSAPRSPLTSVSDSLLEEPCTPLTLKDLGSAKEQLLLQCTKENFESMRESILENLSHDITDPRFLDSFFSGLPDYRQGRQYISPSDSNIDDVFHRAKGPSQQTTHSSLGFNDLDNLNSPSDIPNNIIEKLRNKKSEDVSKMLLSAVGRNLFSESTNKNSTPKMQNQTLSNSMSRRHSVAGLEDISRRLSSIHVTEDTSLWGMEVSDHLMDSNSSMKKSKSFQSLSCIITPPRRKVPLAESMEAILKDPEARCQRLNLNSQQSFAGTSDISGQSAQWWGNCEMGMERGCTVGGCPATKGSGRAGCGGGGIGGSSSGGGGNIITEAVGKVDGDSQSPGVPQSVPASRCCPVAAAASRHLPSSIAAGCSQAPVSSPLRNLTLPLPSLEMSGGLQLSSGGACCSVPPGPSQDEELSAEQRRDLLLSVYPHQDALTVRQQRRQEESSYRLLRMLQDCPGNNSLHNEPEDSTASADWSMEAMIDQDTCFTQQDLDEHIECSNTHLQQEGTVPSPVSPVSQDTISLCTLDSELADGIYLSPSLCDKIKQVSEEKMLARLRRSFRGKKGQNAVNNENKEQQQHKIPAKTMGIVMFVENPMYLSPEIKKEAKIVNKDSDNTWYVSNPMYNSPEINKVKNINKEIQYKVQCEKENLKNAHLAKVVAQSKTHRKPLGNIWMQSNPCYESPEVKKLQSKTYVKRDNRQELHRARCDALLQKELNHYLTPIHANRPRGIEPLPTVMSLDVLANDKEILDVNKFLDHEYCTIPGDDSDSWITASTSSKNSSSPIARRELQFDGQVKKTPKTTSFVRPRASPRKLPVTPSRMWRETGKNVHSTPRKYQGTLEKNLDATMGTRARRTPRAVKRGNKNRDETNNESPPKNSPPPPPLPARPHPNLHTLQHQLSHHQQTQSHNNTSISSNIGFEDTNHFHHELLDQSNESTLHDSKFQLPPDSVYESITFLHEKSRASIATASPVLRRSLRPSASPSRSCSKASRGNRSKSLNRRSRSFTEGPKNGLGPLAGSHSHLNRSKGRTPAKKITKKYRARDVLQGKGQLKLAVYENFGLLTIHVIEGTKLKSRFSSVCNPYVKISLVPDSQERTFCRTPLVRATNKPHFDQKFSFDFLPEDLDKRLLISVWSRDTLRKRSEFLGCMSFSMASITQKRVHGWFRLLTEALGRRKHFAVSFLNNTQEHSANDNKMEDLVIHDENTNKITHLDNRRPPPSLTVTRPEINDNYVENRLSVPSTKGQTPYTISVNIVKGQRGFGFSVAWTKPPRIERVEPGLPADQAGLKPGDYVIFVGNNNVVKYEEEAILEIIRQSGGVLNLEVYRRGVSKTPRPLNGIISNSIPSSRGQSQDSLHEQHPRKKLSHIAFNTEVGWGLNV
ncbi:unnamed protein product, partial [Meganyctiphanes norvegica]